MLTIEEIKQFMTEDFTSDKKTKARKGQAYYEGDHDIRSYRLFYYNNDGELVEDTTRSNIKIPHPFFTELVDQAVQYILSGKEGFIKSDIPELQAEMDAYFNDNEDFVAELTEALTDCQTKGFAYMYAYKDHEDKIAFQCADAIGVIEVEGRFASDKQDHVIYWYVDRIDKDKKQVKKVMVWDAENAYFYTQTDNGDIEPDNCFDGKNAKPHTLYKKGNDAKIYGAALGFVPFFRLDNNKKQVSNLKTVKDLIDDYDLMASSLSNNLVDFDTPIHVVKGFDGDDLSQLQTNLKTKKVIGVGENGDVEIRTVDVPYQARQAKLDHDEKNIYRFGMGLNTAGLKDTNATTNIAIKSAYSLLDLKCSKLTIRLKQFLRKILKVVIDEVNKTNKTDYQMKDIYFNFEPEVMSNAQENAQIALTEAQEQQTRVTTFLNAAAKLDNETLIQNLCDILDIDYEKIKGKLPDPDEATNAVNAAQGMLDSVAIEGGGTGEQTSEASAAGISE